jgi:hypothetical protein
MPDGDERTEVDIYVFTTTMGLVALLEGIISPVVKCFGTKMVYMIFILLKFTVPT